MSDSDDDMPPPLDDFTEQISKAKEAREKKAPSSLFGSKPDEDEGEEIRLKPKPKPQTTVIPEQKPQVQQVQEVKPAAQQAAPQKKQQ